MLRRRSLLALTGGLLLAAGQGSAAAGGLRLRDFTRDRGLFDSGAARGENAALVPLSGEAPPGAAIAARATHEDGTPASDWQIIATAGPSGAWAGGLRLPRASGWLRAEARLAEDPSVTALTQNRFGVGHVFALWGQSEIQLIHLPQGSQAAATETLLADDMVQILWGAGVTPDPQVKHLSAADSHTAQTLALANVLIATRPDEKFAIVFHAVAGTHFSDLFDDSQNEHRSWAADKAVHDLATADGQHIGMAAMSWFAAPRNLGRNYGEVVFGLMTGRSTGGAALSLPRQIPAGASGFTADHDWRELYDDTYTRWLPYGPHRFDPRGDLLSARRRADGKPAGDLLAIERARLSWRAAMASPAGAGVILPMGLEPNGYLNGYSQDGEWKDIAHPGRRADQGGPLFARLTAHALLQGAGLTGWPVPEFDHCAWQTDGAYIELWSSAGPVVTARGAGDGLAVLGFEINDQPAPAELAGGRVRVRPATGAPLAPGDVLTFGAGGASGALRVPGDFEAGAWADWPLVANGAPGVAGIPLRAMPDPALLASPGGTP